MTDRLDALSDDEIVARLEELVHIESQTTLSIVRHLAEIERRRLYAKRGYSSLFDYTTRGLGYSSSAAMRRIKAARTGKHAPKVFDYLDTGELTLSTIEVFAPFADQCPELVEVFRGASREEAERLAAPLRPIPAYELRDRIKPIVAGEQVDLRQQLLAFEGAATNNGSGITDQSSLFFRSAVAATTAAAEQTDQRYQISFSAGEHFVERLQHVQELMFRGKRSDIAIERVFGEALELYIDKHCPKARQERRKARAAKAEAAGAPSGAKPARSCDSRSRRVPVWLKDMVLERDGHRCSYVSPSGVPCEATFDLEIDHVVPFARGGETRLENLRVLCATHNLICEVMEFGEGFVGEEDWGGGEASH